MRLLDLLQLKYIKLRKSKVNHIAVKIEQDNLLDLTTKELRAVIYTAIEKAALSDIKFCTKQPTCFDIEIKDKNINKDEHEFLVKLIAAILAQVNTMSELRDRESRLAVPAWLNYGDLTYGKISLLKMINYKCWYDVIGGFVVINGKEWKI